MRFFLRQPAVIGDQLSTLFQPAPTPTLAFPIGDIPIGHLPELLPPGAHRDDLFDGLDIGHLPELPPPGLDDPAADAPFKTAPLPDVPEKTAPADVPAPAPVADAPPPFKTGLPA